MLSRVSLIITNQWLVCVNLLTVEFPLEIWLRCFHVGNLHISAGSRRQPVKKKNGNQFFFDIVCDKMCLSYVHFKNKLMCNVR